MTSIDLLTPVVPDDQWHPNFRRIHDLGLPEEREVLRAWADGFVDRDGKFVREFQTTFNSSFWELYLHALLRDAGCGIDFTVNRPDFVVTGGPFGRLLAEAVVASNPTANAPEWVGRDFENPTPRAELLDLACLRLAQAIAEKAKKWNEGYQKLPQCATGPFVVCAAPFEQPGGQEQGTEAIDRVLFGGERPIIRSDDEGVLRVLGETKVSAVFKPSGADVKMGMFTTGAFSQISAVLFSSLATWSKVRAVASTKPDTLVFEIATWHATVDGPGSLRYQIVPASKHDETLEDGLHLFVNPHAQRPIDPGPWLDRGIAVHQYRPGGTLTSLRDGSLMMRSAWQFGDVRGAPVAPNPAPSGTVPHRRSVPRDGEFFAGPSRVGVTDSIELTLHRGHTIYVGRDIVDGDWCVLVKAGAHLSIEEFVAAGEPWMGTFVETREAALAQARAHIDGAGDVEGER